MANPYLTIVEEVLREKPETRDCDELLTREVYRSISPNLLAMSYVAVNERVRQKKLPSVDTISRLGRKLKLENEELRGKEYLERQLYKTKKALTDLNYR